MTNCSQSCVMNYTGKGKLFVLGDRVWKFRINRGLAIEPEGGIFVITKLCNSWRLFIMTGHNL
jgi:hypothetical protein